MAQHLCVHPKANTAKAFIHKNRHRNAHAVVVVVVVVASKVSQTTK